MTRGGSTKGAGFKEDAFWRKIARLPGRASSRLIHQSLVLYCLLTDKSTPAWVRALIAAALVYLVNPFDAVPDALPGIGLLDDAAAIGLVLHRLAAYVTPSVEARARGLLPWGGGRGADGPVESGRPRTRKPPARHRRRQGATNHDEDEEAAERGRGGRKAAAPPNRGAGDARRSGVRRGAAPVERGRGAGEPVPAQEIKDGEAIRESQPKERDNEP